jgi:hypothetical protein
MIKVKDLPKGFNLQNAKVRLPDDVLKAYQDYNGGEQEMWIGGPLMGDWWLSPDEPGSDTRRLYPMPQGIEPIQMLEWQVVEIDGLYKAAVESVETLLQAFKDKCHNGVIISPLNDYSIKWQTPPGLEEL